MSDTWNGPADEEAAHETAAPDAAAPGVAVAAQQARSRGWRHRGVALAGAALVAVGAAAGALGGHALWSRSAALTATTVNGTGSGATSGGGGFGSGSSSGSGGYGEGYGNGFGPGGSGGFGSGGAGGYGAGSSSGSSGPSDAAAIAKNVDPGLVDITTTLKYQNAEAAGTGMVLTSTGEVLTNNHVIDGATSISVRDVGNNTTYRATVVGYDRSDDVAVLQLQGASGLSTVSTASTTPSVGAAVVAVGNAGGTGGTPSYAGGSITATGRSITASDESDGTSEKLTDLLETDADVQAGDSGGPLVNEAGKVVGMDTAGSTGFSFSGGGGSDGYAIPISRAVTDASAIVAGKGSATVHIGTTAMLGVEVAATSSSYGSASASSGAAVAGTVTGGPAATAGLAAGDVITAINGQAVDSPDDLSTLLGTRHPGDTVTVAFTTRSGTHRSVSVQLTSGPPQ